ncbi:uncharacterized protein LOC124697036 [Lolium rigidum]|uniref:uncharacterized protein LOC124697036 n=1 Tax=Lolium rigidum TaxID=89674 RepID=UPI001F5C377D|nr:uncharacterized protein LOC124697036 [Lolium rigidum]
MATAAARSPSPGQARPCSAMRRSADSCPFKPADCPHRTASISKGGAVCGCHASPRRRSFGEKENDQQRDAAAARTTSKPARASGPKNFMSPTISAASKAVAAASSPSPRKRVLGERNEDAHLFAPFSPANLAHKPKATPPPEAGSARRLRLSFDGPPPAAAASFGEEDAGMENHHHHAIAAAESVDAAEPSRAALYDPKTNYTSPRPRFLHYRPNPRIDMYRHGGSAARRLDEGLASSESSEESLATTTDDDLAEEEQEQAQQLGPEEPSALAAAPSEAEEAAAVPAAVSCVLPQEPAPGSPRAPVLTSEPAPAAATSPPARVLATEPRATSPPARALTPEPKPGVSSARAPEKKKRSMLRFMFPLALILLVAAAFASVSLPPDSPIMANPAVSKVSSFLSVQELHPVELAAWLKQWSSSSLDSVTAYWEAALASTTQEQEYFGPHFAANFSAASADADHGADFYYNFAEAMPSDDEPIGATSDFTALLPEGDVVLEEESLDDDAVEEEADASEYYKVVEELGVETSEEAPGSNGASFLEEQLNIHDADLSAQAEVDAVMEEESIDAAVPEELDLEMSEEAPDNYGEEMASFSQNSDIPSEPIVEPEQDVETDESQDDHTNGKDEGEEVHRGLKPDSSMWPSYLDKISKPAAGVALLVVILSAGIAVFSMRKKQTQVVSTSSAPVEEPEQPASALSGEPEQAEHHSVEDHHLVKPSQSVSGSSEGHVVRPSQFQSSMAEETERFGDSVSQYSSSLSSGQGRRRKTIEEENLTLEPASRRESTTHSTSSYGSFTTFEKISAKKKNKDDEAMTPVRRSSRLRTVKSPEAQA